MPKTFQSRALFFLGLMIYLAINIFLLNLWIKRTGSKRKEHGFALNDKFSIALILFYLIFIIISIYLIMFPITISDGSSYVSRGIALYKIANTLLSGFASLHFISWFSLAAILLLFFFRRKITDILKPLKKIKKKIVISSILAGVAALVFYFFAVNSLVYSSQLLEDSGMISSHLSDDTEGRATSPFDILISYVVREGPFNTLIEVIMISLFGLKEWALRIPSLLFSLLASFYLYRIVLLFRCRKTALLASLMLLFIPGFFYFTHLTYKEPGLMFFICISSFYLLRYSKQKNTSNLAIAAFFIGAGYLYKDPLLFFIPIFWISWFIQFIISKKSINPLKFIKKNKDTLIFTWFSIVPIIPWLISTILWRKLYGSVLKLSYFSWESLIKYVRISMPYDIGWVLYFIFFIAFLYAIFIIIRKNEVLLTLAAVSFIFINIIYSLGEPVWGAFQRWYLPSLFGSVIILSVFIGDILSKIAKKRIYYFAVVLICSIFVINALLLTIDNLDVQYLPFDKTFKYIGETVPEGDKILATTGPNPYRFYIEKYNIKNEFDFTKWVMPSENQNVSNLYAYCIKNNISYALFPYPLPQQYYYVRTKNAKYLEMPYGTWLFEAVNPYLVIELSENNNQYFKLIKTFELGKNRMQLFKLGPSFS